MKAHLTMDPENKEEQFDIERGSTHHRDGRSDPAIKFATNIASESIKTGNRGVPNKLARDWQKKYCK